MTRLQRLLRLARLRGDKAAIAILESQRVSRAGYRTGTGSPPASAGTIVEWAAGLADVSGRTASSDQRQPSAPGIHFSSWTETEKRAAWGDR